MLGLMMDQPLLISSILDFAERYHGSQEIVSLQKDDSLHRTTYRETFQRVRKLAQVLSRFDLQQSDRIGTLAWNDVRHLEVYYATSCSGYVCHTLNPRLFDPQMNYVVNHAEDRLLLVDPDFFPLVERLWSQWPSVQAVIVLCDEKEMPETSLENVFCYETLLSEVNGDFEWPVLEENAASSLCYTSGTTGDPKGVLYSHRSTVLHSLGVALPDVINLSMSEVVMPIVPMFHVNAWGFPYSCPMVGAKLVFPGSQMGDGASLYRLIEEEKVTLSAGVPTVWLALLQYLRETKQTLHSLQRIVVGGTALPESIFDDLAEHGVYAHQVWGMTEMSPVGTLNVLKPEMHEWSDEQKKEVQLKQGRCVFGVEMRITDDSGQELPNDGKAIGNLKVRGPWISSSYYKLNAEKGHDAEGWLDTGDIATIDAHGYLNITDRSKDVIKSGGEWISSIELENEAMSHPSVAEAAVIGIFHPKWSERPLLVVVPQPGESVTREDVLEHLAERVVKWWLPEDVVFVEELPHTATGKVSKLKLREQFSEYKLSS